MKEDEIMPQITIDPERCEGEGICVQKEEAGPDRLDLRLPGRWSKGDRGWAAP
jgi:hypothetical protein